MTRTPAEMTRRDRLVVLAICCICAFIVLIDSTGVNVALPSIAKELHATTSQLQWIVAAYLLVLASLLMFSGSLADRIGRRRIFSLGLIIFGLGSALCSISASPTMLIAMRGLQAVGGSMLAPVALSIISNTFTDPKERASALGTWGAVVGIGMGTGPLVGGLLVNAIDWRAVFWVNLPIVAVLLVLLHKFVPESRSATTRSIDVWGQILMVLIMGSLTFAIIEGGETGFLARPALVGFAIALTAFGLFIAAERRVEEPMIEFRYFRSIPFTIANLVAVLAFFCFAGFTFVATLYLQVDRGLAPLAAGLAILPMALANTVFAPVSGWLVGRVGPRLPMLLAALAMVVAAVILMQIHEGSPLALFLAAGVCLGIANGTVNTPITNTAVSGMPLDRAGLAGATASAARQIGQSLGVAVLGASLNAGLGAGQAFTDAARPGAWVILAVAVVIAALAVAVGTTHAKATARAVRKSF